MRKIVLAAFAALLLVCALHAQPVPCGPNPEMTSFCDEACIICDINGFTGINDDPATGQAPPGFCTNVVHHMQWIGFIAGSTNLTLAVKVFNCQQNQGLEVGIYRSLDCQTFQIVSNCDTDLPPNTTTNFTNTVPLVIGQYYYFVMDGNMDDVCNYTITVLSGTTNVSALSTSGTLAGETKACVEKPSLYTVSPPLGATVFSWTLDGIPVASGPDTTLSMNWATPGVHELCVTASNTCDTAQPACQTVVVTGIPPTQIEASICAGECYPVADTLLCTAGTYEFHFTGISGCDSLVRVTLDSLPAQTTSLDLLICDGDSIFIGNQAYFETGQFQQVLSSENGCDSTVNLTLQVIVCEIRGDLTVVPVSCNGTAGGSLRFAVQDGTPPFTYQWERVGNGLPSGSGLVSSLNTLETVDDLPAGTYFITVSDNFGNDVILFADVAEPPPLVLSIQTSDYQGFAVTCFGAKDGTADLSVSGGTPPYTYMWNNGAASVHLENLAAGTYRATATDAVGCSQVANATLSQPDTLELTVDFENPGCDGVSTGTARVLTTTGGVTPYVYDLSGQGFTTQTDFGQLQPGNYVLTARDANGCTVTQSATLVAPLIPNIELGPDLTVNLGESIPLELLFNVPLDTFIWRHSPGLSCYDCPEPEAEPYFTTTYLLTVAAPGGCTDADSVTVRVNANRHVYVPNTFSPNDDGENDRFTVYSGPEVRQVGSLQVFSRWGELVFRREDFPANDDQSGWDGTFRGKTLPPGVFTWVARVEFLDQVVASYSGTVTIVR